MYYLIYNDMTQDFTSFFNNLRDYFQLGNIDIAGSVDAFFIKIGKELFQGINTMYKIDDEYLSCFESIYDRVQPFGSVPITLASRLQESFLVTKMLIEAVKNGHRILNRAMNVNRVLFYFFIGTVSFE